MGGGMESISGGSAEDLMRGFAEHLHDVQEGVDDPQTLRSPGVDAREVRLSPDFVAELQALDSMDNGDAVQ